MKISIFSKYSNNQNIVETIKQEAMRFDFEIDDYNPDIIIYVGGDGTFLNAIQNNTVKIPVFPFVIFGNANTILIKGAEHMAYRNIFYGIIRR